MTPITWYLYGRSGGAKKAVEEIGVKESASGDIAVISDGADDVAIKSLVAEITPVQSGSGDPSPTNIRPISGRTGLTVVRAGKNLLNMPTYAEIQAASSVVGYKSIALNLTPNTTYYLSTTFINGYTANGKVMYILLTNSATTNEPWVAVAHSGNVNGKVDGTMTTGADGMLWLRFNSVTEEKLTELYANSEIQLEVGTSATAYEPYHGASYPVSWQTEAGTIYGGTLDVVSGVLTVTHAVAELDENWYWYKGSTQPTGKSVIATPTAPGYVDAMSHYKRVEVKYILQMETFTFLSNKTAVKSMYICMSNDETATPDDFKNYIVAQRTAGTPIQIYYRLATPQTYQLTPTEVRTILGGNNIYTDAGDVTVEYVADTKMYIDNKIAELQALVLENN